MSSSEDDYKDCVFSKEVYKSMGEDRGTDTLVLFDEIYNMLGIKEKSLVEKKMKNLRLKIEELELMLEEYKF